MDTLKATYDRFVVNPLNKFLSSRTGLTIAIIVPLLAIPGPHWFQVAENILSSNWLQLWALFVLGIMQVSHHTSLKKHIEKHATPTPTHAQTGQKNS